MVARGLITKRIKEYLESNDILLAVIRASTDLEFLLFDKLFFEKGINPKLIENWTLGRFIDWNL